MENYLYVFGLILYIFGFDIRIFWSFCHWTFSNFLYLFFGYSYKRKSEKDTLHRSTDQKIILLWDPLQPGNEWNFSNKTGTTIYHLKFYKIFKEFVHIEEKDWLHFSKLLVFSFRWWMLSMLVITQKKWCLY